LPIEARIFIAALAFRVCSALIAFLANVVFPLAQDPGFSVFPRQDHLFWDAFARYDSGWYHQIASQGYEYKGTGRNNLAFFPAYPLLMRAGAWLLGGRQQDYYFAGIVISWLSFAGAMTLLYRLALLDLPRAAAVRAVIYSAVFPAAFFFGMVYSESLYLLTVVASVYFARTARFAAAGAVGALMTATRVTAVIAVPGIALVAWQAAGADAGRRLRAALATAACGGGIVAFSVFNWMLSGKPFTWYESITFWGYHPGSNPFSMLLGLLHALVTRPYGFLATERMAPYDTLNAAAALLALALVPIIWKRFNAGYALIVLAALLLPLSSGQFEGLGRYTSVQFPVALALASLGGEVRHYVVLAVFAALYGLCLAMFVNVHPLF
jgi:Gpi18-like mannosyltransferase